MRTFSCCRTISALLRISIVTSRTGVRLPDTAVLAAESRRYKRPNWPFWIIPRAWRLGAVQDEEQEARDPLPLRDVEGEQFARRIGRNRRLADDHYLEA